MSKNYRQNLSVEAFLRMANTLKNEKGERVEWVSTPVCGKIRMWSDRLSAWVCPLVAVCNSTHSTTYGPHEALEAGARLGLDRLSVRSLLKGIDGSSKGDYAKVCRSLRVTSAKVSS